MEKSKLIEEVLKKYDPEEAETSFANSKYLPKLLDMVASDEDLNIMVNLPATSATLAEKLKIDEKEAAGLLKNLYMRGLIVFEEETPGEHVFRIGNIGLLIDGMLFGDEHKKHGKPFYDLMNKHVDEEMIPSFPAESLFRVIPVEETISREETNESSKIVPMESASEILKKAKVIVLAECACRTREKRCDSPMETCFALDNVAEWHISRGIGRKVSLEEALEVLKMSEENGLIHQTMNSDAPDVICNCCSCCCGFLRAIVTYGVDSGVAKSRYMAKFDLDKCRDCKDKQLCVQKCIFGGIKLKNGELVIDSKRCWGCGLCASVCPEGAITMKEVRKENHIPKNEAKFYPFGKKGN